MKGVFSCTPPSPLLFSGHASVSPISNQWRNWLIGNGCLNCTVTFRRLNSGFLKEVLNKFVTNGNPISAAAHTVEHGASSVIRSVWMRSGNARTDIMDTLNAL